MDESLLLWSGPLTLRPQHPNVLLWHGAAEGARSIADVIERHADEVRRRYLAWSYELGEIRVGKRILRQRFRFDDSSSLWAHSLFVEKSMWRQHGLESLIKVMALERLLDEERPASLQFAGPDRALHQVLARLCASRGMAYSWTRIASAPDTTKRRFVQDAPRLLQGLMALCYFAWTRMSLRTSVRSSQAGGAHGGASDSPTPSGILFCGPFFDPAGATTRGPFTSQFWTQLPALLRSAGYRLTWLHYFYAHTKIPKVSAAERALEEIKASDPAGEIHALVDSRVTPLMLIVVAARWLSIAFESLRVGAALSTRFKATPREIYWPLIRDDWARTFRGYDCVENLLYAECFDRALRALPRQRECLYLMENQNWERALARAWRRYGHGRLTAVAHSTIRYWDLRYHADPRQYGESYRADVPASDAVALNGPAARAQYLATSAHREEIVDVEALRYLHLDAARQPIVTSAARRAGRLRLLVLGDYTRERTDMMLRLIAAARRLETSQFEVRFKAHPTCPVDVGAYPDLELQLVTGPIAELVPDADLVLASNTTSAAVDAYASGGRVLVHDDRSGLNLSPLRGIHGVRIVCDAADLGEALTGLARNERDDSAARPEFFAIDPMLPGWRRHLGIPQSERTS